MHTIVCRPIVVKLTRCSRATPAADRYRAPGARSAPSAQDFAGRIGRACRPAPELCRQCRTGRTRHRDYGPCAARRCARSDTFRILRAVQDPVPGLTENGARLLRAHAFQPVIPVWSRARPAPGPQRRPWAEESGGFPVSERRHKARQVSQQDGVHPPVHTRRN